jgi:hypothetical protein
MAEYEALMSLLACQTGAPPVEESDLVDKSACNWFLEGT